MSSDLIALTRRRIQNSSGKDGFYPTEIKSLTLMNMEGPSLPARAVYKPSLCITVQGAKQVMLGDAILHYGAMQYLLVSVDLPILGKVTRASADEPFLGLILEIDATIMRDVLEQLAAPPAIAEGSELGIFVDDLPQPIIDCAVRLLRLLDMPGAIAVLYPTIVREIYFWLLSGSHGPAMAQLASPNGHAQRIGRAISALRNGFSHPVRIEDLAAIANMSPSSFHEHFKAITSLSPLQYQKQLRLLEARRLMVTDAANAAYAAYQVGYESASQFSREYARMFGAPPRRDIAQVRSAM